MSHPALAQGTNLRIAELECDVEPEAVVIVNEGASDIDLTGWKLQSDPTAGESLPLDQLGILSRGESILIEIGPSSTAAFVWSRGFVFRNGDATDFAQVVNAAGEVVVKANCVSVQPSLTATPVETSAPAPSTTPPADAVPFGGGPPGVGAGLIPPAAMIVAGSWLLSAGLGTVAVPLLHRGRRSDRLDQE